MRQANILFRTLLAAALLLPALPAAQADDWSFVDVERVVAMSDLHGAHSTFVETLEEASLIDDGQNWTGGQTHLVIVGDILDRGPDSRQSMDLLMQLETQAADAGGRVHVLIGNHEAMNLVGDLRYVAKEEYDAFAGEETGSERNDWFERFREHRAEPEFTRSLFDEQYPDGFFAHREAFSADGHYGEWLLEKPVLVVINGTAFVHGGVSPMIADLGLDGVNDKLVGEMGRYVELLDTLYAGNVLLPTDNFYEHPALLEAWLPPLAAPAELLDAVAEAKTLALSRLHASNGPLWYRGNVACSPITERSRLVASLAAIGADRVVIGHTPTPTRRILKRLGGTVVEVDTGMNSSYYGGSGNALVMEGERLYAISEKTDAAYDIDPHPREVGSRPQGLQSGADLIDVLENGEVMSTADRSDGGEDVIVAKDGQQVPAVFWPSSGRGIFPDLAAFRIDRLVGLDMVPATVRRKLGRRDGSLQFAVPQTLNEAQRAAQGRGSSAQCPLEDQWGAMYVFDALIYNEGRTQDRMQYDRAQGWKLLLTGHERAFSSKRGRPAFLSGVELNVTRDWLTALGELDDDVIDATFSDVLDKRRRKALAKRRDELLKAHAR